MSASAPHAFAVLTAGNGATFLYRPGESQQTSRQGAVAAVAPHCVRIERSGNLFRAYESLNGTSWNLLGEQTITMPASAYRPGAVERERNGTTLHDEVRNVTLETATAAISPRRSR